MHLFSNALSAFCQVSGLASCQCGCGGSVTKIGMLVAAKGHNEMVSLFAFFSLSGTGNFDIDIAARS